MIPAVSFVRGEVIPTAIVRDRGLNQIEVEDDTEMRLHRTAHVSHRIPDAVGLRIQTRSPLQR
jgi:hypothetical protein